MLPFVQAMEVHEAEARHEGDQAGDRNEHEHEHEHEQQQQQEQDEDEEEPYLCKLFGTESRFIEFVNLTGTVRHNNIFVENTKIIQDID